MDENILSHALGLYDLVQPRAELIRHNENMTYMVTCADTPDGECHTNDGRTAGKQCIRDGVFRGDGVDCHVTGKRYVLRIHKPIEGFSPDLLQMEFNRSELIANELEILIDLKNGADIPVQTPVIGKNGRLAQALADGTPVTLLGWIDGQTVDNVEMSPELLKNSGIVMAGIHAVFSRKAESGKRYTRYNYDQELLPRIAERIENAARLGIITLEQARTIIKSLDVTRTRFDELDNIHEKHIVHADLGKSNMIVGTDGRLSPIDFSLCGYSHFYMDIGGIYGLNYDDEGRAKIIEGYKGVRRCEIEPRYVEPYFALGVVLFIASQYERAKDWDWFPGNMERWRRDIFEPLAENTRFIET